MNQMKWHELAQSQDHNARHVMGISGGKDSASLAIYIKDHYPDIHKKMEYFFSDTGAELEEVYNLLDKLEGHHSTMGLTPLDQEQQNHLVVV